MRKDNAKFTTVIANLSKLLGDISSIALFGIMVLVSADVFMRYTFNSPIPGTLELSEISVVLITFLCFPYTAFNQRHIRTTFVVSRLPPAYQRIAERLSIALMLLLLTLFIWQTAIHGWKSFETREYAQGLLAVPVYHAKLTIPLGLFIAWLYFAGRLCNLVKQGRTQQK